MNRTYRFPSPRAARGADDQGHGRGPWGLRAHRQDDGARFLLAAHEPLPQVSRVATLMAQSLLPRISESSGPLRAPELLLVVSCALAKATRAQVYASQLGLQDLNFWAQQLGFAGLAVRISGQA